jgi:hypothetical protein
MLRLELAKTKRLVQALELVPVLELRLPLAPPALKSLISLGKVLHRTLWCPPGYTYPCRR